MKSNFAFLLILFTLIFSFNLQLRYELPLYDEALYARAQIGDYGWSPIYMLTYKFLNFFTNSPAISFYLIFYTLNVFGIPLLVYNMLNLLWENSQASFLVCISIIISRFNFELLPKIHNFNFFYLLLLIYFKLIFEDKKWFKPIFYFFLGVGLYIRSDNILIIIGLLGYQFYKTYHKPTLLFAEFLNLIPAFLFLITVKPYWGSVVHTKRNWFAFLDHYYWLYFQPTFDIHKMTYQQMIKQEFQHCHSLADFALTYPLKAFTHMFTNFKKIFINTTFYLTATEQVFWHYGTSIGVMLLNIVSAFFVVIFGDKKKTTSNSKFFIYFVLTLMCLRSLLTSLILQPQDKYIMDFCFVILIITISLAQIIQVRKIPTYLLNLIAVGSALTTLMLFKFPNQPSFYQYKSRQVLEFVKTSILDKKVKNILYTSDLMVWGNFNLTEYQLNDLSNQHQIREDLGAFLKDKQIDLILYDNNLKNNARDVGLNDLYHFNRTYAQYGYEKYLSLEIEGVELFTKKVDQHSIKNK